ncbi:hypothetical protein M23134_01910 [Microscilla marina ATCC 23134]|uniref:Uncharacterized protein n=1 Tax=Microscilla marina ATCC 23134 TaxID=313606 RepID=A1ZC79_MICM2|nr:hypothetical protein M23134_01910 [Microscilla marina ATCC 23134]
MFFWYKLYFFKYHINPLIISKLSKGFLLGLDLSFCKFDHNDKLVVE